MSALLLVGLVCWPTKVPAQKAGDQLLASWSSPLHDWELLYLTADGHLIHLYKLSAAQSDATFWRRETLSLAAVNSITTVVHQDLGAITIRVVTQPNAVLIQDAPDNRQSQEQHASTLPLIFLEHDQSTERDLLTKLKLLTGK